MSNTTNTTPTVPTDTCILMHVERFMADRGFSCGRPAAALWLRGSKSPLPVCEAHARDKHTVAL